MNTMKRAQKYYHVIARDGKAQPWFVAAGFYKRLCAKEEAGYLVDAYGRGNVRIMNTDGTHAAVIAELAKLNRKATR